MKKLIYITLTLAALLGCSKDSDEEIIDEPVVNYLEDTKWQSYTPMFGEKYMHAKYFTFNADETCTYVDSIGTVTTKTYYYDIVNGDPIQGQYYTSLYKDAAKTDEYELLTIDKSLEELHYYWVLGELASVMNYVRIE
ncbi:MAG: hypothetical protein ACK5M7_20525 [Draconibacterium sp.]